MSSYREAVRTARPDEATTTGADDERLPCGECGHQTPRKVLSMLGARCSACYAAYLRAAPASTAGSKADALRKLARLGTGAGGKHRGWAVVLKAREESGERLTRLQRDAWRDVLGGTT